MHTPRPAQQSKRARCIGEGADHFELLDVETFEVLLDPIRVGADVARAQFLTRPIDSHLLRKRASQVPGVVSECRVRPECRRWFNLARRTQAHLVHVRIQISDVIIATTPAEYTQQQDNRQITQAHCANPLPLSRYVLA
ncbi:hypothetical protein D3C72_2021190 [compost metagenome]